MDYFVVVGNPILHSKSPDIYNQIFQYYNLNANYSKILASRAEEVMVIANEIGLKGMNITSPFKLKFSLFIDVADDVVRNIGATNTLVFDNNNIYAHNTDPNGVFDSLLKHVDDYTNKNIIIIGAGGAALAAAYAFKDLPVTMKIFNRTYEKAVDLANTCDQLNIPTSPFALEDLELHIPNADIIISTIAHVNHYLPFSIIKSSSIFFDAIYHHAYKEEIKKYDFTHISGEKWLINQAIHAFRKFYDHNKITNVTPHIKLSKKNQQIKSIAVIGFMGSGKTSFASQFANDLNYSFIDLDKSIMKKYELSIKDIFNFYGESYFREIEHQTCQELALDQPIVVSCGGGFQSQDNNKQLLKQFDLVIYLFASLETCKKRIKKDSAVRPLAMDNEHVDILYRNRIKDYFVNSNLIISSEGNLDDVVKLASGEVFNYNENNE